MDTIKQFARGILVAFLAVAAGFAAQANERCTSLEYGGTTISHQSSTQFLQACNRDLTEYEQLFLGGAASGLLACEAPSLLSHVTPRLSTFMSRAQQTASTPVTLNDMMGGSPARMVWRMTAYTDGAELSGRIGCERGGHFLDLLDAHLEATAIKARQTGGFVSSCVAHYNGSWSEQTCQCVLSAIAPTGAVTASTPYAPSQIRQAVNENPMIGISVLPFQCGVSNY